jgi:hypothetical protein
VCGGCLGQSEAVCSCSLCAVPLLWFRHTLPVKVAPGGVQTAVFACLRQCVSHQCDKVCMGDQSCLLGATLLECFVIVSSQCFCQKCW